MQPIVDARTGWEFARRDDAMNLRASPSATDIRAPQPSLRDATRLYLPSTGDRFLIIDPGYRYWYR